MDNDKIEKYEWCADFETGVEIIDKEHRQLFKIINKLFSLKKFRKGQPVDLPGRNKIL